MIVKLTNMLSEKQAVEETKLVFDLSLWSVEHESYPLSESYSRMLAQPIAHHARVDFTEFYASCNFWRTK